MRDGVVTIGDVPTGLAPGHTRLLTALKEAVQVLQGNHAKKRVLRRAVTFNDLVDLGLITADEVPME
jgi:hypothetical protein